MSRTRTLVTGVSCSHLNVDIYQDNGLTLINICRAADSWVLIWSKACSMTDTKLSCWTISGLAKPLTWSTFRHIRISS
jgi:hypothetical protein